MAKRNEGSITPVYLLWTHSANKEGKHPVKIRITHQRESRYYSVMTPEKKKLFLTQAGYDQVTSKKVKLENKPNRSVMNQAVTDAETAIKEATQSNKKPFTWGEFERKYLGSDSSKTYLAYFKKHIEKLTKKGQAGTVRAYASAYSALSEFQKERDFDPGDLTVQKLEALEDWLKEERELNDTSISIYMRCIRSVYNAMAAQDDYLLSSYPFSRNDNDNKYKIPSGSGGQKGLTLSKNEITDFINGKIDGEAIPENPMYRAKQLFLFSFFAQGANFKDLALLQFSDIGKDTISFKRQKTIRTNKVPTVIRIPLTDPLNKILIEQGNSSKENKNYVFGLFDPNIKYTEKEKDDAIRQWVKTTNKWLRRYCELNEVPVVSTYAARHSFASIAKGLLPVVQISKMLGHSRITTTQAYLGRFEDEENRSGLMKVFKSIKKKSA